MKLITELQQIEADLSGGSVEITSGLTFSHYQTLRTIEFYSNSRYLNGNQDLLARDKPFYNIVNTMVDTAVVATDIDTKDIRVTADDEVSVDKSFLFNHEIQKWMKESDFAKVLNEMGEVRPRYGGVMIKKCVEDDEDSGEKNVLEIEVVDWKNIVVDPVCIEDGVIIEKHFMSPMELRKKEGVWNNTKEAIDLYAKKGFTRSDERIEVWEVEGEFPESYLSEDGEARDDDKYVRQHHFYALKGKKTVHLFYEEQKDTQYKYLPWKRVPGRALGRGVVEEGEEAQVWTNDAVQKKQAAMELSGKVILKTTSKKIGNNVMTDLDNGSIVVLEDNKTLDVLNLMNGAMPQFTEVIGEWFQQYERTTASYDAVRGETPPSGQPYRLQALVAQQGGSHFDYRREEWGIFLQEVFYDWVFPYIEKRLIKQHILASDFTPEELAKLDESFANYEANKHAVDKVLSGEVFTQEDYLSVNQQFKDFIGKGGKRRFIDVPKDYYKDMKAHLTIDVTGETKNKQAVMESLNSLMTSMLPMIQAGIVSPEDVKMVLNRIMEVSGSGLSPMSLSKSNVQAQQGMAQGQPPQPVQGAPQMGGIMSGQ